MKREEAIGNIRSFIDQLTAECQESIRTLVPELTESEDERIRKEIIGYLNSRVATAEETELLYFKRWIAYLEKQKELFKSGRGLYYYDGEKTTYCGYPATEENPYDFAMSQQEVKQKEQNGGIEECTDFTIYHPLKNGKGEYECIPYSFYGSLTSFSEDKDLVDFLRTCFYTKEECNEWIERQKEQKPISEVFGFKVGDVVRLKDGDGRKHIIKSIEEVEGIHGPNFYHVEFEDNSARDGIYLCEEYPNGYYTQMEKIEEEQKLEEEDHITPNKKFFQWIYDRLVFIHGENPDVDYMRSLKDRIKEMSSKQKPAEWSEEDEFFRQQLIVYCEKGIQDPLAAKCVDWLKSLRPQPKQEWSEEDSKRYISIGTTLETSVVLSKEDYDANMAWLRDLVNAIKYFGPRPSWKPSEEQISALERAIVKMHTPNDIDILAELRDNLKKL